MRQDSASALNRTVTRVSLERDRRRFSRCRLALPVVIAAFVVIPFGRPAMATYCSPPTLTEAVNRAKISFIGRVLDVTSNDRVAEVQVNKMLAGSDQGPQITVRGGSTNPAIGGSSDITFDIGTSYVFFPSNDSTPFSVDVCSGTVVYTPVVRGQLSEILGEGLVLPNTGAPARGIATLAIAFLGLGLACLIGAKKARAS